MVEANNTDSSNGFMVTTCSVRHGDDYSNLQQHLEKYNVEQEKHCSPFKSAMVVPVILGLISDNPGCTNKTLQDYLKPYGKEYALTDSILQEARTAAQTLLFGTAKINVTYAKMVENELVKRGHIVRVRYTGTRETLKNVEVIILSEELLQQKHLNNSTLDKDEKFAFIAKWKKDHWELLMEQLGPKCVDVRFLHGIFFAPSFLQATVPELQRIIMADTCHLNFGKYTLYSCYGITANANMFPVRFAIVLVMRIYSVGRNFGIHC